MSHDRSPISCSNSANAISCVWLAHALLCAIPVLAAVAFPQSLRAQTEDTSCVLPALHEDPSIRQYLDPEAFQGLATARAGLCDFLAGKRAGDPAQDSSPDVDWSTRHAVTDEAWRTWVAYAAWCGQKFSDWLQRSSFPEAHRAVFHGFCRRYFDNIDAMSREKNAQAGGEGQQTAPLEQLKRFSAPYRWFRVEYFCVDSGYIASPGGWRGVVQPDIPAMRRLEDKADSLCDDVRSGAVPVDEAAYRWHQELLRFKRRVGPEITQQGIDSLSELFSSLIE